jgi:hypothetical protein
LAPGCISGRLFVIPTPIKHLACTAQRRRQKQIPRPHHHPFLRKHPSSHRPLSPIADHRSKPWLIFTENPQPGTNMTTSHRDRSPPSGVTAALQLVKVFLPHHLHARSRYRQTDTQRLFQPRCRLIPNSQPLTNMPSAEFSAWGVTRPQQRSSYRAAPPAGRYLALFTMIC